MNEQKWSFKHSFLYFYYGDKMMMKSVPLNIDNFVRERLQKKYGNEFEKFKKTEETTYTGLPEKTIEINMRSIRIEDEIWVDVIVSFYCYRTQRVLPLLIKSYTYKMV